MDGFVPLEQLKASAGRLQAPIGGERLVVGGGRANGFPPLRQGDVSLNISKASNAHVLGDIRTVDPAKIGKFNEVFFERVPFDILDDAAATNASQLLSPGGKLQIFTDRAAGRNSIRELLRAELWSHFWPN